MEAIQQSTPESAGELPIPKAMTTKSKLSAANGEPDIKRGSAPYICLLVAINLAVFLSVTLKKQFPVPLSVTEQV